MADSNSLLIKYRPNVLDEVVGQDRILDSLESVLAKRATHSFLLVGPSGTGKTTLARIIARRLGCTGFDLTETDPVTHSGVEDIRQEIEGLYSRPLSGNVKVVIVDECQLYSKNAWTALLKITEDPPAWVYWVFCTTDPGKVPAAIKTRSASYELKPLKTRELIQIIAYIVQAEKLKLPSDVIALCAEEAQGSARQAIANLVACMAAKDVAAAAELLQSAVAAPETIDLVRALYSGANWAQLQKLMGKMADVNAESVRQVVRAYGTKIALSSPKEPAVGKVCEILDAFSTPFNSHDGITPVLLACARLRLS